MRPTRDQSRAPNKPPLISSMAVPNVARVAVPSESPLPWIDFAALEVVLGEDDDVDVGRGLDVEIELVVPVIVSVKEGLLLRPVVMPHLSTVFTYHCRTTPVHRS